MGGRGAVARWVGVGALVAAISGTTHRAHACSVGGFANATIDPALRATDQQPPTLPSPGLVKIKRGVGPTQSGCSEMSTSCDDIASVQLSVAATDDQTLAARIGYRVRTVGGVPPADLTTSAQPIEASSGMLYLFWIDGATDDQEAVDFSLEITAFDGAGNSSPPQTVHVHHGGSGGDFGGCGLTAGRAGGAPLILLAAALIALSARRRRAF